MLEISYLRKLRIAYAVCIQMKIPVLKANIAQSPVHSFPETSSKYSISAGETGPDSSSELRSSRVLFSSKGQFPAPWQLKTPKTPVHLFKFQIFRRL